MSKSGSKRFTEMKARAQYKQGTNITGKIMTGFVRYNTARRLRRAEASWRRKHEEKERSSKL
jgi:hypothetical protein